VSEPFLGEIRLVPYDFAPKGWALCNGQTIPIAQNNALFSLFGTHFGGNGRDNFGLPDLQGRVAIHTGQGTGLSPYTVGDSGGDERVSLTMAQLGPHTHPPSCLNANGNRDFPQNAVWAIDAGLNPQYGTTTAGGRMAQDIIGRSGNSGPHDNIQPYLTLNYVVALDGVWPPRS
jgi:microcystin-dependent protein